jgi:hypothetical protein
MPLWNEDQLLKYPRIAHILGLLFRQCSAVAITISLLVEWTRVFILAGPNRFLSSPEFPYQLWSLASLLLKPHGVSFPGINPPCRHFDNRSPSNTKVKNECNCIFYCLYVSPWRHKVNFTFYLWFLHVLEVHCGCNFTDSPLIFPTVLSIHEAFLIKCDELLFYLSIAVLILYQPSYYNSFCFLINLNVVDAKILFHRRKQIIITRRPISLK